MIYCCSTCKKKSKILHIIIFSVFFLSFSNSRLHAIPNSNIKIGVADGVSSGALLGSSLILRDSGGTVVNASEGTQVTLYGSDISVSGRALSLPVSVSASDGLGWDKTRYRGTLSIIKASKGFTVVNDVDIENYLRGILKIEMNPAWPQEALKAQAIIARTYAVRNKGRFAAKGYDLCSTAASQVYRGINAEDPRTDAAVIATAGMILTWDGKPADTFYHSDSGGATADIAHVWGGGRPYLQPQRELVSYTSPYSTWQVTLSASQLSTLLSRIGSPVGNVASVEVSQNDSVGRAVQLRFRGDLGTTDVKAHAFRMAIGGNIIRSTNFDITAGTGDTPYVKTPYVTPPSKPSAKPSSGKEDELVEMTRRGVFTKLELMEMLSNPDKREEYLKLGLSRMQGKMPPQQPKPWMPAQPSDANAPVFTFSGRGWGHGVGLSQWGAKAMADSGMTCQDILSHYFRGTVIEQ